MEPEPYGKEKALWAVVFKEKRDKKTLERLMAWEDDRRHLKILTKYQYNLLKSARERPKFLHMGHSPVSAIEEAFRLCDWGLINIGREGEIQLTAKGEDSLRRTKMWMENQEIVKKKQEKRRMERS